MATFNVKKSRYDIDQILYHFGLKRSTNCEVLQHWLAVTPASDYVLPVQLERKRLRLLEQGGLWNEEELKMHFISIVFDCADIEIPDRMQLFYERSLVGVVEGTPLSVICDALLASPLGINTPKSPYFFLQEFKKGKKAQDDAEGQMLVAMLLAQALNQDNHPIYGCYLLGKDWCFTTLHEKNYCFSKTYDATETDELIHIIHILQNIVNIVHR